MEPNYNPFENNSEFENTTEFETNSENEEYTPRKHNFQYTPPQPRVIKLNMFEAASMFFGIGAIVSCTCFYGAYIMGALAILFALLSRGGQMKMSSKAKLGLILGIGAIILTTVVTIGAFFIALEEYGSIENMLREYCQMYGLDFEEEFGILFEQ